MMDNMEREKLYKKAESYIHKYIPEAKIIKDSFYRNADGEVTCRVVFPLKGNRRNIMTMECFISRYNRNDITKDEKGNKIVDKIIFFDKNGDMELFPIERKMSYSAKVIIEALIVLIALLAVHHFNGISEEMKFMLSTAGTLALVGCAIRFGDGLRRIR